MAVTPTPKLGLNKQDPGDANWHAALNSGMDAADARFQKSGLPPPSATTGDFVGQTYWQTAAAPPILWVCTAPGSPGTWVQLSQLASGAAGVAAAIVLNNNIALRGLDTGVVARDLVKISAADKISVGALANLLTLFTSAVNALKVDYGSGEQTVWHAGNDGAGSTLDADTVDGIQAAALMTRAGDFVFTALDINSLAAGQGAHGLGAAPSIVSYYIEKTAGAAENGWVVGDRVFTPRDHSNSLEVGVDATNIYWMRRGSVFIVGKSGGFDFAITLANWKLVAKAWL